MGSTTRTSVSVPVDLKRRMEAVDEPVNWSTVACQAFEAKLAEIITRKGAKSMDDVILRLRASRKQSDDALTVAGREAGRAWAKKHAEAAELERLATLMEDMNSNWQIGLAVRGGTGVERYSFAQNLYFQLRPECNEDHDEADSFWTDNDAVEDADGNPEAVWVDGFADGALEVWSEVEGKL